MNLGASKVLMATIVAVMSGVVTIGGPNGISVTPAWW